MHERGDADHELIDENERERFAGTSADPDGKLAEQSRGESDAAGQSRFERTGTGEPADAPREEETPRR